MFASLRLVGGSTNSATTASRSRSSSAICVSHQFQFRHASLALRGRLAVGRVTAGADEARRGHLTCSVDFIGLVARPPRCAVRGRISFLLCATTTALFDAGYPAAVKESDEVQAAARCTESDTLMMLRRPIAISKPRTPGAPRPSDAPGSAMGGGPLPLMTSAARTHPPRRGRPDLPVCP